MLGWGFPSWLRLAAWPKALPCFLRESIPCFLPFVLIPAWFCIRSEPFPPRQPSGMCLVGKMARVNVGSCNALVAGHGGVGGIQRDCIRASHPDPINSGH